MTFPENFSTQQFTLHFATINTKEKYPHQEFFILFTLHFATINTKTQKGKVGEGRNLHYTLLLLIQDIRNPIGVFGLIYITLCYY